MTFEIAIEEVGSGGNRTAYAMLPANKNTIIDAMDRAKVLGKRMCSLKDATSFPS